MDIFTSLFNATPSYNFYWKSFTYSKSNQYLKPFISPSIFKFSKFPDSVTLLEIALFYKNFNAFHKLLALSQYETYRNRKAEELLDLSIVAGSSMQLLLTTLEILNTKLTLKKKLDEHYLHLAVQYWEVDSFIKLYETVLQNSSADSIFSFLDNNKNNLYHLIAIYGRRDILLKLSELHYLNFLKIPNQYLSVLNIEDFSPYAMAVASNNYDIAELYYYNYGDSNILLPEEYSIKNRLFIPVKPLAQIILSNIYLLEAQLLIKFFSDSTKLIAMIKSLRDHTKAAFSKKLSLDWRYAVDEKHKDGNLLKLLKDIKKSPNELILIKDDTLVSSVNLLLSKNSITKCLLWITKKDIIKFILKSKCIPEFLKVLIELKFILMPSLSEILAFYQESRLRKYKKNKLNENMLLWIMELTKVFAIMPPKTNNSSLKSSKNLINNMLTSPYSILVASQGAFLEQHYEKVEISYLQSFFKNSINPEEVPTTTQENLVEMFKSFMSYNFFQAWSLELIYSFYYNKALLELIKNELTMNSDFIILLLQEHPFEIPWIARTGILSGQNQITFTKELNQWTANGIFKDMPLICNEKLSDSVSSGIVPLIAYPNLIASLFYLLIYFPGECVVVKKTSDKSLSKDPKRVFEIGITGIFEGLLKLYNNDVRNTIKKNKNSINSGKATNICYILSIERIFSLLSISLELLEKIKCEEEKYSKISMMLKQDGLWEEKKPFVDEKEMGKLIIKLLSPPHGKILIGRNGLNVMTLKINTDEVINYLLPLEERIPSCKLYKEIIKFYNIALFWSNVELNQVFYGKKNNIKVKVKCVSNPALGLIEYKLIHLREWHYAHAHVKTSSTRQKVYGGEIKILFSINISKLIEIKPESSIHNEIADKHKEFEMQLLNAFIKIEEEKVFKKSTTMLFEEIRFFAKSKQKKLIYSIDLKPLYKNIISTHNILREDTAAKVKEIIIKQHIQMQIDIESYNEIAQAYYSKIPSEVYEYNAKVKMLFYDLQLINFDTYTIIFMEENEFQEKKHELINTTIASYFKICKENEENKISQKKEATIYGVISSKYQEINDSMIQLQPATFLNYIGKKMQAIESEFNLNTFLLVNSASINLKINVAQFMENIAVPLNLCIKKTPNMKAYSYLKTLDSVTLYKKFCENSTYFKEIVQNVFAGIELLHKRVFREIKLLVVNFNETKSESEISPLPCFPLIDRLINLSKISMDSSEEIFYLTFDLNITAWVSCEDDIINPEITKEEQAKQIANMDLNVLTFIF